MDVANFSSLQSAVQKLPKELQDMILHELLIVSLRPGRVFPHQKPGWNDQYHHRDDKPYSAPRVDILLALDHKWLTKANRLLYTQNTWCVGSGGLEKLQFLRNLAPEKKVLIKAAEISFNYKDPFNAYHVMKDYQALFEGTEQWTTGPDWDEARESCRVANVNWLHQCGEIWQTKLEDVAELDLQSLTLDFWNAYWPNNVQVRILACMAGGTQFIHGIPPQLYIVGSEFLELEALTVQEMKAANEVETLDYESRFYR